MDNYTIIETFINEDNGLKAHLTANEVDLYGAIFIDSDAGETICVSKGNATKAAALAKIEAFVNGGVGGWAPAI